MERLRDLGALGWEGAYDAHAAKTLVARAPQRYRDPIRRAIEWCVTPFEAVHRWVQGVVEDHDGGGDGDYEIGWRGSAWASTYADMALPLA